MSAEVPEISGLLLRQAEQGQKLAEVGEGLARVELTLTDLSTAVRGIRGTQAAQGELLEGLAEVKADVASLQRRVDAVFPPERSDGSKFYDPPPSVRIWELDADERAEVVAYLAKWVNGVWKPTFGHLSRKLPACWAEHWLCITIIDVLSELHKVLWMQPVRLAGTLSGQAEFITRLAPALADLMAREREGCQHQVQGAEEQNGAMVIQYGRRS